MLILVEMTHDVLVVSVDRGEQTAFFGHLLAREVASMVRISLRSVNACSLDIFGAKDGIQVAER